MQINLEQNEILKLFRKGIVFLIICHIISFFSDIFDLNASNRSNFELSNATFYEKGIPDSDTLNYLQENLSIADILLKLAENSTGEIPKELLQELHKIVADKFDLVLLEKFYSKFGNEFSLDEKNDNYAKALLAEKLQLPFRNDNFKAYNEFIRATAPSDRAFSALQNMIAADVTAKRWSKAVETLKKYQPYFGKSYPKITKLIEILNSPAETSVKILPLSENINTIEGAEYSPVLPNGESLMFFCGAGRKDNRGGEDIYISEYQQKGWSLPKLIPELSSAKFNDAPVSISADGTVLLFVRDGKFFTSNKTSKNWTEPQLLNGPFYSKGKVIDGAFTPDGKGILFSVSQSDILYTALNIAPHNNFSYSQSDIYIVLKDENNLWANSINIGNAINTNRNERSPFLHADMKTLYFSSDGHGGLGKMDVFKSVKLSDSCWTCWSAPENLGKELNTTGDDVGFKINVAGDKAYFARNRNPAFMTSILLLIDISGSMSGQKIEKVKSLADKILSKTIITNSEVALLTFSGVCTNPIVDSCGFETSLLIKEQFIENLTFEGKTTTSEAYKAAVLYLKRYARKESGDKLIFVITDEDECVCNKANVTYQLINQAQNSDNISTLLFDVSEDSILFSNLTIKNAALSANKYYSIFSKSENSGVENLNLQLTGYEDIYEAILPQKMRPNVVSAISGKVVDSEDKPVNAQIKWNDIQNLKNGGAIFPDPQNGTYYIALPHGRFYEYFVASDDYLSESHHVDLMNETKPQHFKTDIKLFKIDELLKSGEVIRLNNVFFDFDKSDLLSASKNELLRWAEIIRSKNLKVEVTGHTDNVGDKDYNMKLSENRAAEVVSFLVSLNCNPQNIKVSGFGESKPRFTNDTPEGRALNRRVELKITGKN